MNVITGLRNVWPITTQTEIGFAYDKTNYTLVIEKYFSAFVNP